MDKRKKTELFSRAITLVCNHSSGIFADAGDIIIRDRLRAQRILELTELFKYPLRMNDGRIAVMGARFGRKKILPKIIGVFSDDMIDITQSDLVNVSAIFNDIFNSMLKQSKEQKMIDLGRRIPYSQISFAIQKSMSASLTDHGRGLSRNSDLRVSFFHAWKSSWKLIERKTKDHLRRKRK